MQLVASPDSLAFGEADSLLTLIIDRTGEGPLHWFLQSPGEWLIADPDNGSVTASPCTVQVRLDREIAPVGGVRDALVVQMGMESRSLPVTATVRAQSRLRVSPLALSFGDQSQRRILQLTYTGSRSLDWRASAGQGWLSVAPDSGTVTADEPVVQVAVEVDRAQLEPGEHAGAVEIASGGARLAVPVTVAVVAAQIALSRDTLDFSAGIDTLVVALSNPGSGTLAWQLRHALSWVTATPTRGDVDRDSSFVTVAVRRTGLEAGAHTGKILFIAGAAVEPVELVVRMEVPEQPLLEVAEESLDFGIEGKSLAIEIANAGNGRLAWSAETSEAWMTLGSEAGELGSGEGDSLRVDVDRQELAAGSYEGEVRVSSNGGTATVRVGVKVSDLPLAALDRQALDFGTNATEESVVLSNAGRGSLTWAIGEDADWLEVTPLEGTIAGETAAILFTVDRTGLAPGDYSATAALSSNGGELPIAVEMAVATRSVLQVSVDGQATEEVAFGLDLEEQRLVVENLGEAPFNWQLTLSEDWIAAAPVGGSLEPGGTSEILVQVDRTDMRGGMHEAILSFSEDNMGQRHQVRATMEVANHPPVADAGTDQIVEPESEGLLDGTGSDDPDLDPLTYAWTQVGGPPVELADADAATARFTPTETGEYEFALVVGDGQAESEDRVAAVVEVILRSGDSFAAELPGPVPIEFVWIEPGRFTMGMTDEHETLLHELDEWFDWFENEKPAHEVTISEGFYLGKYEITQGQWESVMDSRPWEERTDAPNGFDIPAGAISWIEAQEFVRRLNELAGKDLYRLPTEAEWEYACRAGTTTLWSFGDNIEVVDDYAWYRKNAWEKEEGYPHRGGLKQPNPWGLYDMHGNVWEQCEDAGLRKYTEEAQVDPVGEDSGNERVLRGGSYLFHAVVERSGYRIVDTPGSHEFDYGLRLVRMAE